MSPLYTILFLGSFLLFQLSSGAAIDKVAQFRAYDANQDGKWSREEADYVLYMRNQALILQGKGYDGMDTSGDGGIDEEEYNVSKLKSFLAEAGENSDFSAVDTDQDEYIMPLEYAKAVKNASKKKMDVIFASADTNHDRFISQAEFSGSSALVNSVCVFPCDEGDI